MNRLGEWIDDSVVKINSCLIEQISRMNDAVTVWHTDSLDCANPDKQINTNRKKKYNK